VRTALLALSILLGASACPAAPADKPAPTKTTRCEEDQPCWDCRTMGNKKCGFGEQGKVGKA